MRAIIAVVIFMGISGCGSHEPYDHRFQPGDIVQTKLGKVRGMVITTYKYHGTVRVRFASNTSMTTNNFLGGTNDVTHKPFAIVRMQDFELEPYDGSHQ